MTKNEFIIFCRGELGVTEYPAGSNKVKYNTDYYGREVSGSAYKWCAVFVWDMFRLAGMADRFYGGGKTASCGAVKAYYNGRDKWYTSPSDWQVGDLVIYDWSGKKTTTNHIGIVTAIDHENRRITSIEGNTAVDDEDNGGCVMERTRAFSLVCGTCRIEYDAEEIPAPEPEVVPEIEESPETNESEENPEAETSEGIFEDNYTEEEENAAEGENSPPTADAEEPEVEEVEEVEEEQETPNPNDERISELESRVETLSEQVEDISERQRLREAPEVPTTDEPDILVTLSRLTDTAYITSREIFEARNPTAIRIKITNAYGDPVSGKLLIAGIEIAFDAIAAVPTHYIKSGIHPFTVCSGGTRYECAGIARAGIYYAPCDRDSSEILPALIAQEIDHDEHERLIERIDALERQTNGVDLFELEDNDDTIPN